MRLVRLRSVSLAASTAALLVSVAASSVAAHSQTVRPPAMDEPVVSGPISNPWAQAHCHAASPALVYEASGGVVRFSPSAALPCPLVPNPGGQVHGD
jgi:hypothetical protein